MTATNSSAPQKQCTRCKQEFPATNEYFSPGRNYRDGLQCWCKSCHREYGKRRYPQKREKVLLQSKARYQSSPEKKLAKAREWDKANPEKRRAISQRSYQLHCDDEERRRARRANEIRYKARKRSLPDNFTTQDWEGAAAYFHGCCAVCGRQANDLFGTHTLAADHWIPLTSPDCPGTVPWNIVPLCHGQDGCNNQKNGRDAFEWLTQKFGKRKAKEIMERIETYFKWVVQ